MLSPLRAAAADDLPAIVTLMNAAYRGTAEPRGWTTEAGYIRGDRTSLTYLVEEITTKPEGVFLVSGAADLSLGACVWLERLSGALWYLGSLTVSPALQNAGLGRELLAASEQWALLQGARRLRITVVNVRSSLIAWYERRGYQLTGETHPFPYDDQRFGTPMRADLYFVVLEKELTC